MPKLTTTVAEYLSRAIDNSGLTQKAVADAVGYPKPNVISMMKMGQTKVPIDKIPALAKTLGLDPRFFIRLAMREYMPETWNAVEAAFGQAITQHESELLNFFREVDPEETLGLDTLQKTLLMDAIGRGAGGPGRGPQTPPRR